MNTEHSAAVAAEEYTYSAGHVAAFRLWQAKGMSCRDLDEGTLTQLLEDRNFTTEVNAERQRRANAAVPPMPVPSRPAAPAARVVELARYPKADDMKAAGWLETWLDANKGRATPVWLLRDLFDETKRALQAARATREDLESRVLRLEAMLVVQTNQIKNLESSNTTRGLVWAGEFSPDHEYKTGEFCKRAGAVWLAVKDTTSAPGMDPGSWELVIKGTARP